MKANHSTFLNALIIIILSLSILGCSEEVDTNKEFDKPYKKERQVFTENPYKKYAKNEILDDKFMSYFVYEYCENFPQFYEEDMIVKDKIEGFLKNKTNMVPVEKIVNNDGITVWKVTKMRDGQKYIDKPEYVYCGELDESSDKLALFDSEDDKQIQPNGIGFVARIYYEPSLSSRKNPHGMTGMWPIYMGEFDEGIYHGFGKKYKDLDELNTLFRRNGMNIIVSQDFYPKLRDGTFPTFVEYEGYFKDGLENGEGIVYNFYKLNGNISKDFSEFKFDGRLIAGYGNFNGGKKSGEFIYYIQDNNGVGFKWCKLNYDGDQIKSSVKIWDVNGDIVIDKNNVRNFEEIYAAYDLENTYVLTDELKLERENLQNRSKEAERILQTNNINSKVLCTTYTENTDSFLSIIEESGKYDLIVFDKSDNIISIAPFSTKILEDFSKNQAESIINITIKNAKNTIYKNLDGGTWFGDDLTINYLVKWNKMKNEIAVTGYIAVSDKKFYSPNRIPKKLFSIMVSNMQELKEVYYKNGIKTK